MGRAHVWVVIAAGCTLAGLAPAVATTLHEENVEFIAGMLGFPDPATRAFPVSGVSTTAGAAIEAAATRAGEVRLASLFDTATTPLVTTSGGAVWVIEVGAGACSISLTNGLSSAQGHVTLLADRTLDTSQYAFGTDGFTARGQIDPFCFVIDSVHFAFPITNGVVSLN